MIHTMFKIHGAVKDGLISHTYFYFCASRIIGTFDTHCATYATVSMHDRNVLKLSDFGPSSKSMR